MFFHMMFIFLISTRSQYGYTSISQIVKLQKVVIKFTLESYQILSHPLQLELEGFIKKVCISYCKLSCTSPQIHSSIGYLQLRSSSPIVSYCLLPVLRLFELRYTQRNARKKTDMTIKSQASAMSLATMSVERSLFCTIQSNLGNPEVHTNCQNGVTRGALLRWGNQRGSVKMG